MQIPTFITTTTIFILIKFLLFLQRTEARILPNNHHVTQMLNPEIFITKKTFERPSISSPASRQISEASPNWTFILKNKLISFLFDIDTASIRDNLCKYKWFRTSLSYYRCSGAYIGFFVSGYQILAPPQRSGFGRSPRLAPPSPRPAPPTRQLSVIEMLLSANSWQRLFSN